MADKKSKPSTEPNVSTEDAFLDAAERLFAERGFEGTRVRAIAEAANANLGALHYYWGSKEALFAAVWERRMAGIVEQRREYLDQLKEINPTEVDLSEVLSVWIEVGLGLTTTEGDPSEDFQRLFGRAITDPSPSVRKIVGEYLDESGQMLVKLIQRIAPELSDTDVFWRLHGLLGAVLYAHIGRARLDRIAGSLDADRSLREGARHLAAFVAAGFKAPPVNGSN